MQQKQKPTEPNHQYLYPQFYFIPHNVHIFNPIIYQNIQSTQFIQNFVPLPTTIKEQPSVRQLETINIIKDGLDDQERKSKSRNLKENALKKKIKRKQRKFQKKSSNQKKYNQNIKRNFFSNIARLVINFLNSQEKSSPYLYKMIPQIDSELSKEFYKYIKKFKRSIDTYIKRSTFYSLLGLQQIQIKSFEQPYLISQFKIKKSPSEKLEKLRQITRKLSKYYLQELILPVILRSRRMNSENRWQHLILRRQLILAFESIRFSQIQNNSERIIKT